MNPTGLQEEQKSTIKDEKKNDKSSFYYSSMNQGFQNPMNMKSLDNLLEKERQYNKSEHWNKLDKTQKTQILHSFAEKYGREKGIPMKEIKQMKLFFNHCLERGKLSKVKDVVYNKETREIDSIPSLFFNAEKKQYTLRNIETKRVSTLKSLTPKKNTSLDNKI